MFIDGEMWCHTINYSMLACYRWKQNWKITSVTDFMAFLAKALFRWNKSLKNADISILSNFLAIFFGFFLHIEKFYPVLSTCQISDQLDHPNRNYRGGPYQFAKSPACLGLTGQKGSPNLSKLFYYKWTEIIMEIQLIWFWLANVLCLLSDYRKEEIIRSMNLIYGFGARDNAVCGIQLPIVLLT